MYHNPDLSFIIIGIPGGLDFFYSTEAHARKMVDFLNSLLPCKYQHSKRLISHDIHSNIYNNQFTYRFDYKTDFIFLFSINEIVLN